MCCLSNQGAQAVKPLSSLIIASLFALVLMGLAGAEAQAAQGLQIDARDGALPVIEAELSGEPVRLIVALDIPAFVIVNASAAERAGLRATPVLSRGVSIQLEGEEPMRGRTGRPRLAVEGGEAARRRAIWIPEFEVSDEADGYIGIGALDAFDEVTLVLQSGTASQQEIRLAGERGLFNWELQAASTLGALDLSLSLIQRSSLDERSLRQAQRLGLVGAAQNEPVPEPIAMFGMGQALMHPNIGLLIAGLYPETLVNAVSRSELALHDRQQSQTDPDDLDVITVTGRSGAPHEPYGRLGWDVLRRCARLTFDMQTDDVTLTCPNSSQQHE